MKITATALFALASLTSTAFATQAPREPERPWTLMIYGAADNNADGPILDFLDSVRTALDDDPGMELLLFIDRSEHFSDDEQLITSEINDRDAIVESIREFLGKGK